MSKMHVPAAALEPAIKNTKGLKSPRVVLDRIECPLGKEDAASILGISADTLDEWTARRLIPHIKYDVPGNRGNRGKVLYLPSDLLKFRTAYRMGGRDIEAEVEAMMDEASK